MSTRQKLFYQRENFPGILHQSSGRTNAKGWEDFTDNKNDILHQNSPDRFDWNDGVYMRSLLDGVNEGGELAINRVDDILYFNITLVIQNGHNGTIAAWNNNTTGAYMRIFMDAFGDETFFSIRYYDGAGTGNIYQVAYTTLPGATPNGTILNMGFHILTGSSGILEGHFYQNGVLVEDNAFTRLSGGNTVVVGGFSYENFTLGYHYSAGSPIDYAFCEFTSITVGYLRPTTTQEAESYNHEAGISSTVVPKSQTAIDAQAAGLLFKPEYPSGRLWMDSIGTVDAKLEGSARFQENPSLNSHRKSAVRLPSTQGSIWSVPNTQIDTAQQLMVWSVIQFKKSILQTLDLLHFWGITRYEDAMLQRINTNHRGIFRTYDDGAQNNQSVGSGSDWIPGGPRQSFTCAIDRLATTKIAHVGPNANSGSKTDINYDWDDTIGDLWINTEAATDDVLLSELGFGNIVPDDPTHIALDQSQILEYVGDDSNKRYHTRTQNRFPSRTELR